MPGGTLKPHRGNNGFGFVAPPDCGPDLFAHVTAVLADGLIPASPWTDPFLSPRAGANPVVSSEPARCDGE